jgi:NADPH:quinone reductase-like Zn-dependent oxidoreductase/acyl carrier protein/SAM-dependent methyltransferase
MSSDGVTIHPLLGQRALTAQPAWHGVLSTVRAPWLQHHRVGRTTVLPATGFLEAALAAGRQLFDTSTLEVTELSVTSACVLPGDDSTDDLLLQTGVDPQTGTVNIASRTADDSPWQPHAQGRVRRLLRPAPADTDLNALRARLHASPWPADMHYRALVDNGITHGPAFQVLTDFRLGDGELLASYRTDQTVDGYLAHPVVTDGALQAGAPLLAEVAGDGLFLPVQLAAVRRWHAPASEGYLHVRLVRANSREAIWDVHVMDHDGRVSMELQGCRLRRFDHRTTEPATLQELVLRAAPCGAAAPVHLPPPAELMAETATAREQLRNQIDDHYDEVCARTVAIIATWARQAIDALVPGVTEFGIDELCAALHAPERGPYLRHLAGVMCEAGLAEPLPGTGRWRLTGPTAVPDPREQIRALLAERPEALTLTLPGLRCGMQLPEILRGEADVREILFGEADQHVISQLYSNAPHLRLHNAYAAELLAATVRHWAPARPLRILEVGAGTGSLTGALLPVLPPERTVYTFTDRSAAFMTGARQRFSGYDFVEYGTLDLDQDPTEQGYRPGHYDVVVAGDALHTAKDLTSSVTRLAGLLADGGMLLALESHDHLWASTCFGLLDDHWSRTDTDLRPESPLLARDQWKALLTERGFDAVACTGEAPDPERESHSVILARRAPAAEEARSVVRPAVAGAWAVAADTAHELAAPLAAALGAPQLLPLDGRGLDDALPADPDSPAGLVVLVDSPDPTAEPVTTITRSVEHLRDLVGRLDRHHAALWLILPPTGLFPAPERSQVPEAAALWALGRTIASEYPHLDVRMISLERTPEAGRDVDRLIGELRQPGDEREVVLTAAGRFVPRLTTPAPHSRRQLEGYRLSLRDPGMTHRLVWEPQEVSAPAPGEVLVAVRAAALNYRDVMLATGLIPDDQPVPDTAGPALGLEGAGEVVSVGAGVIGFQPGDRVFGSGIGWFSSHVAVRAEQLGHMPQGMTFAQAATLSAVFLTAQYSLERQARLRAGERVLVHGAAGGVGLAALQYARSVGADVVATAGTPAKRALLHMLGVEHVLNSRDLRFAEAVKQLTDGQGVDVVLNSLSGEAISRGLECLRPGGRFVELGKRDLYANTPVGLGAFRRNIAYFGVDVATLPVQLPETAAEEFTELCRRVADGRYRPLPHQVYSADRITEAFRSLRHSRHLGKIVIELGGPVPVEQHAPPATLAPTGSYLVTGGLGGLGGALAELLARRGARHLVLIGRRGLTSPEAPDLVARLEGMGVQVTAVAADAGDRQAMGQVFADAETAGHPVRGVIHAAMVLDDAPLAELTAERIEAVLHPKVRGAAVLSELTQDRELDFFLVCSSLTALAGNLRQSSYVAANAYLEALIRRRRAHSRPGNALALGGVSETGVVVRAGIEQTLHHMGLGSVKPAEIWRAFEVALADGREVGVFGRVDWERVGQLLPGLNRAAFSTWRQRTGQKSVSRSEKLRSRLAGLSDEAAAHVVSDELAGLIAEVLQTAPERIDRTCKLDQLGLDSLMVVELSLSVNRRMGCDVPALEFLAASSLDDLGRRIRPLVAGRS